MKKLISLLTVCLALLLAAPASATDPGPPSPVDPAITDGSAAGELSRARSRWDSRGVRSYRLKVDRMCFCAPPGAAVVTVRRGKVVKVSVKGWGGPFTVPGLFRIVDRAVMSEVAVLDVRYNARLGFVNYLAIDVSPMIADDEVRYRVTAFRQL
ncbi:MAG: hypothetical protein KDB48_01375 [Solirubrobacterales bacterium]|nr:hypothetical protein [Solirubrobacterales bacterium]HMT04051.1 DUF6174 domain-containing protein [Solirubrobacterales bacterium]